jgi:hypothetical protein
VSERARERKRGTGSEMKGCDILLRSEMKPLWSPNRKCSSKCPFSSLARQIRQIEKQTVFLRMLEHQTGGAQQIASVFVLLYQ